MNTKSSINQLKRKAYLDFHQDGIIDILLGATILGFAFMIMLDNIIFSSLSWLSFTLYTSFKNAITIPRFGYVQFREENKKTGLALGLGIGLLILVLVLGILFILGPDRLPLAPLTFLRKFHVYLMSGIGAILMVIFGLGTGIKRLLAYGLGFLTAIAVSFLLEIRGELTLMAAGGVILLIGLVLMFRFIRRYPAQPVEVDNAV